MNNWKRILTAFLTVAMLISMCSMMASCRRDNVDPSDAAIAGGNTFVVNVKTEGGMPLSGIAVYVYADDSLKDLKQFKETDEKGKIIFNLEPSKKYAVTLSGVPKGYDVKESYSFKDNIANIVLSSALIEGEDLTGATLGLGDVMYDFTVTTPAGEKIVLSEMLKKKNTVLINFWYTTCTYCVAEFPYMQKAYETYGEDVGIIALNPMEQNPAIQSFQEEMQLTFPMAACPAAWSTTFNVSGYPTSIVVDRYGVICLVEAGGITSQRPWTCMFDHFTADEYEQKLFNALSELVTVVKPTFPNEKEEDLAAALNANGAPITYRHAEGDDAEYAWPFIIQEKDGGKCVKASNQGIDDSYSILIADVELKAGQALGMDYIVSSENGSDILHVIVDDEPIYQISGHDENATWKTCYPWVATEDGTYEVVISYIKDGTNSVGEDVAYIRNLRVVDSGKVDYPTYIPRYAATEQEDGTYSYVNIVLNTGDNYYHVGDANGPLLLANLQGSTQFSEEETVWDILYESEYKIGGQPAYDVVLPFFSMASNSALNGFCTVTKELAEHLKAVAEFAGFDEEDPNEWLKLCKYYQAYGTGGKQMDDPVKGLMPFNAHKATLGKNVASNYFQYSRVVMPRGYLAEFIPSKSGVYRITSHSTSQQGVDGWIFDKDRNELLTYEMDERTYNDDKNVSMVYYMKAGTPYYIDIAFWDVYEEGVIPYDIEYIGASYDLFRLCSPGYFTYDSDATGDQMYYLIQGGIDVVLKNGKYYHDLGGGKAGSLIYADFSGVTSLFSNPIATVPAYNEDGSLKKNDKGEQEYIKGMIDMGGFDFSKTEDDLYIVGILKKYNGDTKKADEYLKEQWGADYDANAENYQLEDVYAGKYHGKGPDLTEEIRSYVSKMKTGPAEMKGCVEVDARLAEILQMLMEKYTFENVDNAWLKVCYYYDHLG